METYILKNYNKKKMIEHENAKPFLIQKSKSLKFSVSTKALENYAVFFSIIYIDFFNEYFVYS